MRPANWTGVINVKYLDSGVESRFYNEITDDGLEYTAERWLGQSAEVFESLQIEGAGVGESVAKTLAGSYTIEPGVATVTSSAIFTSSEVSFDVITVALIGSLGTRIAQASISITAGNAVEITREDILTEVT